MTNIHKVVKKQALWNCLIDSFDRIIMIDTIVWVRQADYLGKEVFDMR